MVQQSTLDFFLLPRGKKSDTAEGGTSAEPEALRPAPVHTTSTACQAAEPVTSNHLLRTLTYLGTGMRSGRRARTELQHHGWGALHQVMGYECGGAAADEDTACITGISLCSASQRVAFTQASGVLNLYPIQRLIRDAENLQARCNTAGASSHTSAPDINQQQPGPSGQEEALGWDQALAGREAGPAGGTAAAAVQQRTVGTRTSSATFQQSLQQQQQAALQRGVDHAWAAREALPLGGWRVNVGHRLSDVAWSPTQPGVLVLAGGSANQVSMMELGQGTQRMWPLTARTGRAGAGARLSSVAFMPQGPYSLCACAQHGSAVQLWDVRRGRVAVAEVLAPGNTSLSSNLQVSADGHLLYAATNTCQLLIWDLRKGSSSSGVMHFGGTGLYHHPLLAQHDLSGPLQRAWHQTAGGSGAAGARWQPVIDSVVLDPTNCTRLALITQDCSAAVMQLPSCTVSHMWLCEGLEQGAACALHSHRRYVMQRKRGCWAAQGDLLLLPQVVRLPDPEAPPPDAVEGLQGSGAPGLVSHPGVGLMDCRSGAFLRDEPRVNSSAAGSTRGVGGRGQRRETGAAAAATSLLEDDDDDDEEEETDEASEDMGRASKKPKQDEQCVRSLSVHRIPAAGVVQKRPVSFSSAGSGGGGGEGHHGGGQGRVLPVSGWVTCVADASALTGHNWLLAGTQTGQLTMIGTNQL